MLVVTGNQRCTQVKIAASQISIFKGSSNYVNSLSQLHSTHVLQQTKRSHRSKTRPKLYCQKSVVDPPTIKNEFLLLIVSQQRLLKTSIWEIQLILNFQLFNKTQSNSTVNARFHWTTATLNLNAKKDVNAPLKRVPSKLTSPGVQSQQEEICARRKESHEQEPTKRCSQNAHRACTYRGSSQAQSKAHSWTCHCPAQCSSIHWQWTEGVTLLTRPLWKGHNCCSTTILCRENTRYLTNLEPPAATLRCSRTRSLTDCRV